MLYLSSKRKHNTMKATSIISATFSASVGMISKEEKFNKLIEYRDSVYKCLIEEQMNPSINQALITFYHCEMEDAEKMLKSLVA